MNFDTTGECATNMVSPERAINMGFPEHEVEQENEQEVTEHAAIEVSPEQIENKEQVIETPKKTILVFSGGGIKGLALIGCLKAFEKQGMLQHFTTFAGTSVGALMLSLFILGYSPDELYVFIKKFNFGELKNIKVLNLFTNFGIDDGSKMKIMIEKMICAKDFNINITLQELYQITNKTLIMTTVCLNTFKAEYLSHLTHPNLPLVTGILMTTCIPWFYTPIEYMNKLYIDGGCIDPYPIHLFKKKVEQVLGIYLVDSYSDNELFDNLESFSIQVFKCFMKGVAFNSKKGYEGCTIDINLKNINAVDYDLNPKQKKKLCLIGLKSVLNHFQKPIDL